MTEMIQVNLRTGWNGSFLCGVDLFDLLANCECFKLQKYKSECNRSLSERILISCGSDIMLFQ